MRTDFEKTTFSELFKNYAQIRAWAKKHKLWGQGNIVGSYTEHLVSAALGLDLKPPATPGYDATDKKGKKYQIKGLFNSPNLWAGWSSQEKLRSFDYLVCVIFDDDGGILHAHVVPQKIAEEVAFLGAQRMWWIYFKSDLWKKKGVRKITKKLRNTIVATDALG